MNNTKQAKQGKKLFSVALFLFAAMGFVLTLVFFPSMSRADGDVTPPIITSFSITPETVDTSMGDQTLTLTMTVEDDSSGVCITGDCGDGYWSPTQARLQSIGNDVLDFWDFTRISGNANSGTYAGTATLPVGSRLGPWSLLYIHAVDQAENIRIYDPWRYPSNVVCGIGNVCVFDIFSSISGISGTVVGNSGSTNSFSIDSEYSLINPMDGTKVTFPAGTVITRADGGSFEIYKLVNQEASIDGLSTDGLSQLNKVAEVLKLGIPGLNLSFSQPVQVDLKVDESLSGKKLTIKSLDDGDANWVNESSCRVREDTCTFTISHASYFAAVSKKKVKVTSAKLKFSAKKRVKRSRVKLKIKTNKYSYLDISVNGNTQRSALANKKGKYNYWAENLVVGQNTIIVTTTNSKGTVTRSRTVTRRQ